MSVDWRLVLFEIINFLVLLALLRHFLFRPVREALERRRAEIEGEQQAVAERQAAAARLEADYRERLAGAEREGQELRETARQRGEDEAAWIVREARDEMDRAGQRAAADLERDRREALEGLRQEVQTLAIEAASQLVRQLETPDVATAFTQRAIALLREEHVDPEPGAPLLARLSPDADPSVVRRLLEEALPQAAVTLEEDPRLSGGVYLRLGDLEVSASAGDALRTWLARAAAAEPAGQEARP